MPEKLTSDSHLPLFLAGLGVRLGRYVDAFRIPRPLIPLSMIRDAHQVKAITLERVELFLRNLN